MPDEPKCATFPGIPTAKSVDVDVCSHGNVTLVIHGKDGRPLAVANFTLGTWAALSNYALEQAERVCPEMLVALAEASASEIDPKATKH